MAPCTGSLTCSQHARKHLVVRLRLKNRSPNKICSIYCILMRASRGATPTSSRTLSASHRARLYPWSLHGHPHSGWNIVGIHCLLVVQLMTRIKVQTFQTDRQQEGRPSLKFSPSSLNTRSRLWAILYTDLWEPGVLRDVYPMDFYSAGTPWAIARTKASY